MSSLTHVGARLRHHLRARLASRTVDAGESRGAESENASSQAVPSRASTVFLIDYHHHRHQQPASSRIAPMFILCTVMSPKSEAAVAMQSTDGEQYQRQTNEVSFQSTAIIFDDNHMCFDVPSNKQFCWFLLC